MRSFDELQAEFAARQATVIGYSPDTMRIFQGACVPAANDDQALWTLLNQLPSPGPIQEAGPLSFFDAYSALVGALVASNHPLDPVAAAKRNLADWGNAPPSWENGYKTLAKRLGLAQQMAFSIDYPATPDEGFWGLWRRSAPASGLSVQFAAAALSGRIKFGHLLTFAPLPGDWYTPSVMTVAYQNPSGPPWNPNSPITWESTFGANGILRRVVIGLVCVSDVEVSYEADAGFTADQQDQIHSHTAGGLWPYYLESANARTSVDFTADGAMQTSITSTKSRPVVIGVQIHSAAGWFGG